MVDIFKTIFSKLSSTFSDYLEPFQTCLEHFQNYLVPFQTIQIIFKEIIFRQPRTFSKHFYTI